MLMNAQETSSETYRPLSSSMQVTSPGAVRLLTALKYIFIFKYGLLLFIHSSFNKWKLKALRARSIYNVTKIILWTLAMSNSDGHLQPAGLGHLQPDGQVPIAPHQLHQLAGQHGGRDASPWQSPSGHPGHPLHGQPVHGHWGQARPHHGHQHPHQVHQGPGVTPSRAPLHRSTFPAWLSTSSSPLPVTAPMEPQSTCPGKSLTSC